MFAAELGGSAEAMARSAGVDPRTLRRWRAHGRRELDALSAEARLALELDRAEEAARGLSWEATAAKLDREFGKNWSPLGDCEGVQGRRRAAVQPARPPAPRISLLHLRGVPWARIGEFVGQRNLAVTANTYSHVLVDEAEVDYADLLGRARA